MMNEVRFDLGIAKVNYTFSDNLDLKNAHQNSCERIMVDFWRKVIDRHFEIKTLEVKELTLFDKTKGWEADLHRLFDQAIAQCKKPVVMEASKRFRPNTQELEIQLHPSDNYITTKILPSVIEHPYNSLCERYALEFFNAVLLER